MCFVVLGFEVWGLGGEYVGFIDVVYRWRRLFIFRAATVAPSGKLRMFGCEAALPSNCNSDAKRLSTWIRSSVWVCFFHPVWDSAVSTNIVYGCGAIHNS